MSDKWPFVGRGAPVAAVREAMRSGAGALIAGEAGVGKSRLADEALTGMTGYTVVRALGTETAAMIPFGAFAHVLDGPPDGGENLLHWAARHLRAQAGRGPLLVSVDDAHRLDPASAALLHYLASHGAVKLLVTVRNGEPMPEPVAALWIEELLTRVELAPLTRDEVGRALAGALRGDVADETVRHLARVSEGNVLYLREVVNAGRATGCLAEEGGQWRWRGELSMTTRLRELVGERIGHLDPDEREVLELVAFGEPLGTELLISMASPVAVERVEDRGLIISDGQVMRLGHPLYGEVVRGRCRTLRARRRLRTLAESLEATGLGGRDDVLRAAVWRLDSGSAADPRMLLLAAHLAWGRQDPQLAARLARAAVDAGAGIEAVALLGQVLTILGDVREAREVLRRQEPDAATDGERAQHALALGVNLLWSGETAEAARVFEAASDALTEPAWRQELLLYRGVVDFLAGNVTRAEGALHRARSLAPDAASGGGHAAALESWVSAHSGRSRRCVSVVERAMERADAWRDRAPHALPVMLDARCAAHIFAGELEAAARVAEQGMELAAPDLSVGGFGAYRGVVHRLRGRLPAAVRRCREDAVRLRARSPYLGRCLAELAHAAALLGDLPTARSALAEAEELAGRWAYTLQPVLQARTWVAAAAGDLDSAVRLAMAAAETAGKCGYPGYLMFALHDAVRLGAPALAADRLAELAAGVDGPLAGICAKHARAAQLGDPAGLRSAAAEFERLGMVLYAAEATAQEAAAYRHLGRGTAAKGAQTRAWALARRCPGVTTPALVELATPELTPRQREIVQLAAAGLTNRQIADRLTLSMRTAANHLQAVYDKLGVNDRTEVARLLGTF
ncbi:LuxR C-terminal-related transcriptional regulator [Nonomuraea sp. NBC_01738]|uniref:LuxR C-terminal-related transcriptional regulator n=1 Tax=Nonomuraea sp. NBC_01738 TaxID=2976003 RepID=UPI002E0F233E|nr:LuxR C-terminal-related transcriptional regulator [Nonomuraea sp. NBC_01738]